MSSLRRRARGAVLVAGFALASFVLGPALPAVAVAPPLFGFISIGTNGPDVIDRSTATRAQTILGQGGDDTLTGSRFGDSISGGTGKDRLVGGPGADSLAGNEGNDTFIFGPGDLMPTPGTFGLGADRITDFTGAGTTTSTQDKIVLDGFGAGSHLVFQRTVPGIFGIPQPRAQVYQVLNGSGSIVGRITVYVLGSPVRHLDSADVSVADAPPAPNQAPVLATGAGTGSVTQTTTAGGTLTDGGSIGWTDAESGQTHTATTAPLTPTPAGSLTAAVSGSNVNWTYAVSNDAIRHLGLGATAEEKFRITLSDNGSPVGSDTADVTVMQHGVNDKPISAGALADQGVTARATASWVIPAAAFSDPDDADTITLSAAGTGGSSLPSWLVFNAATRTFTAMPKDGDLGPTTVVVTATDDHGATVAEALKVTVAAAANEAPVFATTGLAGSVTQVLPTGQTGTETGVVGFADADTLQSHTVLVTPVNTPDGTLTANIGTDVGGVGTVTWSYSVDNEKLRHLGKDATATESFILTLSDGTSTAQQTVVVTEHGINDAPTSTSTLPGQQVVASTTGTWVLAFDQFKDPDDGDSLTWTALEHGAAALPTWLAYDPGTRTFTATPSSADAGTYTIDAIATDSQGETATSGYSLEVTLPPPVANSDTATWTLPEQLSGAFVSRTFSTNVLTNDTGTAALAASGGGTWKLDGDPDVAGTFTVAADGTLTMNSGTDPLGPVQELGTNIKQTATLTYTASDGGGSATGTATITVVGAADPIVVLGRFAGPDQVIVWFNDPVPTYFDSRGCISDPEGAALFHSWEAQTTVAPHPPLSFAFLGGTNVEYVEELNGDWGFNSEVTVQLAILPFNGKPPFYQQIQFGVGDPSDDSVNTGLATVPDCGGASNRPYTPDFGINPAPANTLDLRDHADGATTYTFANVLTSVVDPGGLTFTAFGRGTIGDPADHHGTYVINPNGSITVTLDPAHPIANGETVETVGPYRVTNSAGRIGVGSMTFRIVGRG